MNTILQQRIEEKSKELGQMFFPDNMNIFARPNWEAGYVETACKEIANFALQNQWISLDEALPQKDDLYFVLINSTHPRVTEFENGKWQGYDNITHWMEILKLKDNE